MAAATLRHYSVYVTTNSATTIVSAVPTSRALVISKLLIACNAAVTVTCNVGTNGILYGFGMTSGQIYTETGLVLLAGETITFTASIGNITAVHVFGEEVDN